MQKRIKKDLPREIIIWIFLILWIIIGAKISAQNAISLHVYQDAKLAVMEDDYGNKPFTLDLHTFFRLQGKQMGKEGSFFEGFLNIGAGFERANIEGAFARYYAEAGYTFNKRYTPKILFVPEIEWEITPSISYGWIDRYGKTSHSGGASIDIGAVLVRFNGSEIKIHQLFSWVDRSDLKWLWGDDVIRFNYAVGVSWEVYLKQPKKTAY